MRADWSATRFASRGVPLRATAAARRRGESELFVDTLADLLLVTPPGVASTVITDAASVRRLSSFDTSLRHRVQLHGVVTYVDPAWRARSSCRTTRPASSLNSEGMPLPMTVGDSVEIRASPTPAASRRR